MSILMSIVPHRRHARRTGLPIALIALQACWGDVPRALAETTTPARLDEVGPGVADPAEPRVFARDVVGEQGAAIPLLIEVRHRPGRTGRSTYILGLPKGARLSDANHAVTATEERSMIEVTDWTLADLAVTLPPEQTGAFTLAVAALSLTETGRPLPIARSVFTLRVQPRQAGAAPLPTPVPAAAVRPAAAVVSDAAPNLAPAARRHEAAIALPEAPPRQPLPPEAHGTGPLAPVREAVAAGPAVAPAAARPPSTAPGTAPSTGGPPSAAPQAAAPAAAPQNAVLLARAERLIQSGDISGAKLVLEHLVERGDVRATFLLAQTCDPRMLRAWRVYGLQPDPERASALYARAAEVGLRDPKSVAEAAR